MEEFVDQTSAVVRLRSGGWVELDRAESTATFCVREQPSPAALVHPYLASAAIVAAHWLGRETFHAGGFVAGGGVWAVLGEKDDGKSSLLASLALSDVPVICDDVLVLRDHTAFAGPRAIDLRADAARQLEVGERLGVIGTRERWRFGLGQVSPELPLRGWVTLGWSDEVGTRAIRGAERFQLLLPHRGIRLEPTNPGGLIELSELPMLELRRPRRWDSAKHALSTLLDATGGY